MEGSRTTGVRGEAAEGKRAKSEKRSGIMVMIMAIILIRMTSVMPSRVSGAGREK